MRFRCTCFVSVILASCTPLAGAIVLDETPPEPSEWGFRPADASTPVLNPPGFSWRPAEGAAHYVLQAATDTDFNTLVYENTQVPWSAHCPPAPFPEGVLYWRYAAVSASGERTEWSKTRAFRVTPGAVAFPRPSLDQLIERMPNGHPRLFFRPADIDRFRELANGPLEGEWESVRNAADNLLENPPDTAEPPLYPPGTERGSKEWKRIWWGNRGKVIAVANGAATLAFAYRISGDERYGRAACGLVTAMTRWDTEGATQLRYNDEAGMPALYMTSRAYTWAYPLFSDAERESVIAMMRRRGEQAFERLRSRNHLWRPYSSHSNRLWHFLGETAIAFHGEVPEADAWLDYVMTIMYTAYPVWGDSDGGWHEGTGYWTSYMSRFMWWVAVVRSAFNIDVFERPFYQRTGYYGLYNLPPGSGRIGFADQATSSDRIAGLMAVLAANAKNPHWQWYAETLNGSLGGGYAGFVYAANSIGLEAQAPTDLPASACFQGTGLALMNTDLLDGTKNIQVQFKSSPFGTQSHNYNANNAFLLNMRGRQVLLRTGRRDVYGSPHHRNWMWHTRSDNAILVNNQSQYKRSPQAKGRITFFETTPSMDAVVGEAGASYAQLDRWTRRLVFIKPHAVLIHDVLEAPEPSTYQFMLHAPGAFDIGENRAGWEGEPGQIEVRWLTPDQLTLTQTDAFDPPPADWTNFNLNQWHLTAEPEGQNAHMQFLTLIILNGADATAKPTDDGAWRLGIEGRSLLVRPARAALQLDTEGFARELR